jgi:hypothetical protein
MKRSAVRATGRTAPLGDDARSHAAGNRNRMTRLNVQVQRAIAALSGRVHQAEAEVRR